MDQQGIFQGRTPEAAASQTARVLAWLTECELATLEELKERKSASKRDVHRHEEICQKAIAQCHDLGVEPYGLMGRLCSRLQERLSKLNANKKEQP